jgi:hypothetical protein
MSVAPTIAWQSVHSVAIPYGWDVTKQGQWSGNPITGLSHTLNAPINFQVNTTGSVALALTGTVTSGSNTISSLSSTTGLVVGQAINGPGIPAYSWIASINAGASSLVFRNGYLDSTSNDLTATASGTGVALVVSDPCPIGSLLAAVTPSTGITLTDVNADGSGNIATIGDGTSIINLSGQAVGNFVVQFAAAGTFTIQCTFVTSDTNYSGIAVSPTITVVIS